ncbi:efflux RND transporter periplasmic adaptor subunit [Crenobacter intestini]|uniref:Efflux RND transporter periplasmic adaptor subunit n=1 Tax=Crenobacter intestini TaxID=2563443 RepID=A0A4T0V0W0_9NEIS|nr:efflux RND transporter periplasmic adaptor subunit [Crenobacter intestini]TIC84766.1 efflux RND transporter periplasmic adaptor subunit [Crenobacter intestini]
MKTPWTGLIAVSLALATSACNKPPAPSEAVRPVKTVQAGSAAAGAGTSYPGEVRARHETRLAFRVPGKVVERLVSAGERVKKGQVLARLDATDYALDAGAKAAQLGAARAQLAQQEADLRRARELLAQSFISQAQYDRQAAALDTARAQAKSAQAQASFAGNQQDYAVLRADADGVVSEISAEPGLVVAAGTPVARLAADGTREVAIQLPEDAIAGLRAAKALSVVLWSGNARYPATLREIAGDADPATRTYAARVSVDAPAGQLTLGQTARVELPAPVSSAIALPLTAILDTGGRHYVWLVDAKTHTVKRREVGIAGLDSQQATVSRGLAGGETVVTAGVHLLREGQQVTLLKP